MACIVKSLGESVYKPLEKNILQIRIYMFWISALY